jgi:pimeloyl-ACP methyl ester carboxylesterase
MLGQPRSSFSDPRRRGPSISRVVEPPVPPSHVRSHGRAVGYLIGVGVTLLVLAVVASIVVVAVHTAKTVATDRRQDALAPFYLAPSGWQHEPPGTLLRSAPVGGVPDGGRGWRILYVTTRADGTPAVSSGLVFAPGPSGPVAATAGRPVVAWAHPTIGMGAPCAPSRTADPESDVQGLAQFLSAGWVVAATDYAGLGTRGTEEYLVGRSEAADVLNSVRAARQIPATRAGTQVALWGHSQGGQAVLWSAALAPQIAPELHVVGVAAAAPAAALDLIVPRLWSSTAGSVVAVEVLRSFPAAYPGLDPNVISRWPQHRIADVADQCLLAGLVDIALRNTLGFGLPLKVDPMSVPAWATAIDANQAPLPVVPTYLVQGMDDPLVLPGSNAAYLERACAAGAPVSWAFIGALGHMKAGRAAAPSAFTYFQQRFAGLPAPSDCGTALPVAPLS